MYTPKTAENNPEDFDLLVKECIAHAKCINRKKRNLKVMIRVLCIRKLYLGNQLSHRFVLVRATSLALIGNLM